MKKITKTNLQGLRELFPVLNEEEMRSYVGGGFSSGYYYNGGSSGGYYDWLNHGIKSIVKFYFFRYMLTGKILSKKTLSYFLYA